MKNMKWLSVTCVILAMVTSGITTHSYGSHTTPTADYGPYGNSSTAFMHLSHTTVPASAIHMATRAPAVTTTQAPTPITTVATKPATTTHQSVNRYEEVNPFLVGIKNPVSITPRDDPYGNASVAPCRLEPNHFVPYQQFLHCRNKGLRRIMPIPGQIAVDLKGLAYERNKLLAIPNKAFIQFPNLEWLNIAGCHLRYLFPFAFQGLTKLKSLGLDYNRELRVIDGSVFYLVPKLSSISVKRTKTDITCNKMQFCIAINVLYRQNLFCHGQELDVYCKHVSPCSSNPCGRGGYCIFQSMRSYTCKCKKGYEGKNCKDVDECAVGKQCGSNGKCINLLGSYKCDCYIYLAMEGKHCNTPKKCHKNGVSNGLVFNPSDVLNAKSKIACNQGYYMRPNPMASECTVVSVYGDMSWTGGNIYCLKYPPCSLPCGPGEFCLSVALNAIPSAICLPRISSDYFTVGIFVPQYLDPNRWAWHSEAVKMCTSLGLRLPKPRRKWAIKQIWDQLNITGYWQVYNAPRPDVWLNQATAKSALTAIKADGDLLRTPNIVMCEEYLCSDPNHYQTNTGSCVKCPDKQHYNRYLRRCQPHDYKVQCTKKLFAHTIVQDFDEYPNFGTHEEGRKMCQALKDPYSLTLVTPMKGANTFVCAKYLIQLMRNDGYQLYTSKFWLYNSTSAIGQYIDADQPGMDLLWMPLDSWATIICMNYLN